MNNRRQLLRMLGLTSVASFSGVSAADDDGEEEDDEKREDRKEKEEEARKTLKNNGWTQQNKNIFYKEIERGYMEYAINQSKDISELKVLSNRGKRPTRMMVKIHKISLPFMTKEAEKEIEKLRNARRERVNKSIEDWLGDV